MPAHAAERAHITVVTVTRGRIDPLRRAMRSVRCQLDVVVEHLVIGDACPALARREVREALEREFPQSTVRNVRFAPARCGVGDYVPARLAFLRNAGTRWAAHELIAHLDDDNEYEPDHLHRLVAALDATPGAQAAHSWRRLLLPDGRPFTLEGLDPWMPAGRRADLSYARLCALGVFEPGSSVVRDALEVDGQVVARVDTSELLLRRELLRQVPWPTEYSSARRRLGFSEDLALSHALLKARVRVACSRRPTLRYFMGGYSNLNLDGLALTAGEPA